MAQVYALRHPISQKTRYIGHTCGYAHERYGAHLSKRASPAMRAWVAELAEYGLRPVLVVLAVTTPIRAKALEKHLIGADSTLLNVRHVKNAHHRDSEVTEGDWDRNLPDLLDND